MTQKSLFALAALFIACACASDNTKISPSAIAKQAEKELELQAVSPICTKFRTGTYECNDASIRLKLAQMKDAKLIDYSVKRYAWWEKSKKWSYWGSRIAYDFCDHYIVTVSLTSKGKGLVLAEAPKPAERTDMDLVSTEYDASKFSWGKKDLSENWPEIVNPFVEPEVDPGCEYMDDKGENVRSADKRSKKTASKKADNGVERSDSLAYNAYCELDLDSKDQVEYLRLAKFEVVKVRNIRIITPLSKAEAEAIVATVDVNDAGRILAGIENGMRDKMDVDLTYYVDRGWIVKDIDN